MGDLRSGYEWKLDASRPGEFTVTVDRAPTFFGAPRAVIEAMAEALGAALAEVEDLRAEVARHHADFERWEQMAADGAGKVAAIAARDALLDQALELTTAEHAVQDVTVYDERQGKHVASCETCLHPWPCPTEQWRRAVTELRNTTQED